MLDLQHHYTSPLNLNSVLMKGMHTGAGIEFRPHLIGDDDESDVTSPPLWKMSSTTTTETNPVLDHDYHHHNHNPNQEHEYYYLDDVHSPTSRAKAISRGQQELMDMVKTMPESTYELSLQDLVQSSSSSTAVEADNHELHYNQKRRNIDNRMTKKKKNTNKNVVRLRKSTSMESTNNGSFLLKMFFPTSSLGYQKNKKKKNISSIATPTTTTATCTRSKVSPRPPLVIEGDTSIVEKENWWRKKFSVSSRESIRNNGGSGRMDGRSSSCQSSSRSFSRNMGDFISGCWSTKTKRKKDKTKSREQKG